MDRRKFLKNTAIGTGALSLLGLGSVAQSCAVQRERSHVPSQGWVNEPARQIPVIGSVDVLVGYKVKDNTLNSMVDRIATLAKVKDPEAVFTKTGAGQSACTASPTRYAAGSLTWAWPSIPRTRL